MCKHFINLYRTWVLAAVQLPTWDVMNMYGEPLPMPEKTRQAMEANRKEPAYQEAKQNIIKHLAECDECRKELDSHATE